MLVFVGELGSVTFFARAKAKYGSKVLGAAMIIKFSSIELAQALGSDSGWCGLSLMLLQISCPKLWPSEAEVSGIGS